MSDLKNSFINSRATPGLNILRIASAVKDGETVSIGGNVFEACFDNTPVTGRLPILLMAAASLAAATITGTFSGVGTANDTIVLAGVSYKLVDTLTGVANEVLIGGTAAITRNNFVAAVNAAAGAGTTYGTGTVANPSVSAAASSTADVVITARAKGTPGNSIAISESGTGFSFAGAATTLAGGTDASAADFSTAFALAVNTAGGTVGHYATKISNNEVLVVQSTAPGANAVAYAETLTGSSNAWAAASSIGRNSPPADIPAQALINRSPTATEVALGTMHFVLAFVPTRYMIQVRTTATGAARAWDGTVAISGNRITLAAGATPIATTETVSLLATE